MTAVMNIRCNGEERSVPVGTTINRLLEYLEISQDTVVVELDRVILKKDQYDSVLDGGAVVEIIRFVGGG